MQINSINTINFSAGVDKSFKNAVQGYYMGLIKNEQAKGNWVNSDFDELLEMGMDTYQAKEDEYKLFGTSDMVIKYKRESDDKHTLYIQEKGQPDVVLASKKTFRQLLERFYNIGRNGDEYSQDEVSYIVEQKRAQQKQQLYGKLVAALKNLADN